MCRLCSLSKGLISSDGFGKEIRQGSDEKIVLISECLAAHARLPTDTKDTKWEAHESHKQPANGKRKASLMHSRSGHQHTSVFQTAQGPTMATGSSKIHGAQLSFSSSRLRKNIQRKKELRWMAQPGSHVHTGSHRYHDGQPPKQPHGWNGDDKQFTKRKGCIYQKQAAKRAGPNQVIRTPALV